MLLMQAQENIVELDEEQLLFITCGQDNAIDEDVDEQPVRDLALNVDNAFQADDCDAFDFDVDKDPTAQTMFMANLSFAYPIYDEVQPALYNGHELIKTNHVLAIVHNSEETLEIAETTRKKINDKMKDPECVKKKVKIAPHAYSKENYLATFTPQKQLTPEQIFWSKDLLKIKEEALKEQTIASRPIKELTMYPPNMPATLVPMALSTKSQVKINIFALIQLLLDFEKTYKKRITPTGLTEGERGFEQTKEWKHDEIERKNLIANDNLIADCLSKDVFYTATDYVLTVFGFSDMHEALNAANRIAKPESKNSNLQNKIQNYDHDVMETQRSGSKKRQYDSRVERESLSIDKEHSDTDAIHDLKALDS
uniref:Retrovirus-related Pol polyprotein from transposon TNT 1-94 n=1 Tax=Tanacetum cinerariifolium TaxID=118510 RepID=A0A6L2N8T9_TANCI|nr:hypothetical protein [Tanacetum cinerariifolium]